MNEVLNELSKILIDWDKNAESFFNSCLALLLAISALIKLLQRLSHRAPKKLHDEIYDKKPRSIQSLQLKFLPVFWLFRMAFWMSGPYLYAVYASKEFNGKSASVTIISRIFLAGFIAIAVCGPMTGRFSDQYGRKKGAIAAAFIYCLGALSTQSNSLWLLFLGRALGGIGTSLLSNAPEAWIISEFEQSRADPTFTFLRETFGWAYSFDSLVAIAAGKVATVAANKEGPGGPFLVSPTFLAMAAGLIFLFWTENVAKREEDNDELKEPTVRDATRVVLSDSKIMMVGAVQSLFEGAMYIFVLQWPPAIRIAVERHFGEESSTPYGTIFSCFMATCLFGSTLFGQLCNWCVKTETSTTAMLAVASGSLAGATFIISSSMNLFGLVLAFFVYEACVGMYFPSIGTLRGKFIPDSHRSVIMTLFGVPLNTLVVSVFLFIKKLGMTGAMAVAAAAVGLSLICLIRLQVVHKREARMNAKKNWLTLKKKVKMAQSVNLLKGGNFRIEMPSF